jgi:hypothetical protein
MQRYHLLTAFFELAGNCRPRVTGFYKVAPRLAERLPLPRIAQQSHDRLGERAGVVSCDEMPSWLEGQAFGTDRGGDDRLGHGERFENLEPSPAAGPERHDVYGRFTNRRPHVLHGSGDVDADARSNLPQARGWIASDHGERGIGDLAANSRQDRVGEIDDRVLVRMPVH